MKIHVLVKTKARTDLIQKIDETHYSVSVHAAPHDGEANEAIIATLAMYFGIAKSRVTLVRGHRSKQKTFEIQ